MFFFLFHKVDKNQINGYLALPDGADQNIPGIILIHEWWGLNDDIRKKADYFASQGYPALAVDLYNGENTLKPSIARKLARNLRDNMDEAFTNLKAALEYLKKQRIKHNPGSCVRAPGL